MDSITKELSMLVSIITVCLNGQDTIKKTIESVLNQSYKDIEYIIIDGKSTDNTVEIIKSYEHLFDGRMRYISEKDSGIYDAMNKGIRLSSGELIGIISSNDWYEKDAVESIVNSYSGNRYEIVYGMQKQYIKGIEKECIIKKHEFISEQMICHPACFVTKNTYQKYGLFDTGYHSSSDYEFYLRINNKSNVVFTPVYSVISNFSLGGISSTNIGNIETARIRYHYGLISKNKMIRVCMGNYIKIFIKHVIHWGNKR